MTKRLLSADHGTITPKLEAPFLHMNPGHFVIGGGDHVEQGDWWMAHLKPRTREAVGARDKTKHANQTGEPSRDPCPSLPQDLAVSHGLPASLLILTFVLGLLIVALQSGSIGLLDRAWRVASIVLMALHSAEIQLLEAA